MGKRAQIRSVSTSALSSDSWRLPRCHDARLQPPPPERAGAEVTQNGFLFLPFALGVKSKRSISKPTEIIDHQTRPKHR